MLANASSRGATVLLRVAIKLSGLMTLRPPVEDAGLALEKVPTEADAESPPRAPLVVCPMLPVSRRILR